MIRPAVERFIERCRRPRWAHLWILILVVAIVFWFFWLRPEFLGGPAGYTFVSGNSMEPALKHGDLAITRKRSHYEVGDIVSFEVPEGAPAAGSLVIHRIVDGSPETGFVTKGDSRSQADVWTPRKRDVKGELWVRVPGGGRVIAQVRSPGALAFIAAVILSYVVLATAPDNGKQSRPDPRRR